MDYFIYTLFILIELCFIGIFYCVFMMYKNNLVYEFRTGLLDALDKHSNKAYISNNKEYWLFHHKMFDDIMDFLNKCDYDEMMKKSIKDLKYNAILHGRYLEELKPYLPEKYL